METLLPWLCLAHQLLAEHEWVRECCQHIDLAVILLSCHEGGFF